MNDEKQKIAKTSKVVAIILKVSFILVALSVVVLLLGIGVLTLASEDLSISLQQALTMADSGIPVTGITVYSLVITLSMGIILLLATFMVFFTLYRLFANISCEHTPFVEKNVKIMKKAAIWTIIMCIIEFIASGITDRLLVGETTFELKFIWLIVAAVIYCIALIFDYGCRLQRESDELL